jgi:competence protein ComEC
MRKRNLLILILVAANLLVWLVAGRETPNGILTIAVLDVGQGDAIYIEAPNGNQVLVDAGAGRQILAALGEVMPFYDRSLDLLIATHPDADHVGGFPAVLQRFQVSGWLESGMESETATWAAVETARAEAGLERLIARQGLKIILDEGVALTVLWPVANPNPKGETNDASIVARLDYGETSALLTGDAPTAPVENYLLAHESAALPATLLKIAHHGSRYSSSLQFLKTVNPQSAAISVGAKNRYGHPAPQVLSNLAELKIPLRRTDERGTVVFKSDGQNLGPSD